MDDIREEMMVKGESILQQCESWWAVASRRFVILSLALRYGSRRTARDVLAHGRLSGVAPANTIDHNKRRHLMRYTQ